MTTTLSADIVSSTTLEKDEVLELHGYLEEFLAMIDAQFSKSWGRIVRGDGIECALSHQRDTLRCAMLLKCYIKAFHADSPAYSSAAASSGRRRFVRYGVRIAVGFGGLRINDSKRGIIDGESIYNSGRALEKMTGRSGRSMTVAGLTGEHSEIVQALFSLVDALIVHASAKQCRILVQSLLGTPNVEIARMNGISQAAVAGHLSRSGWKAMSEALKVYENILS